jgi:hypothetical protein
LKQGAYVGTYIGNAALLVTTRVNDGLFITTFN